MPANRNLLFQTFHNPYSLSDLPAPFNSINARMSWNDDFPHKEFLRQLMPAANAPGANGHAIMALLELLSTGYQPGVPASVGGLLGVKIMDNEALAEFHEPSGRVIITNYQITNQGTGLCRAVQIRGNGNTCGAVSIKDDKLPVWTLYVPIMLVTAQKVPEFADILREGLQAAWNLQSGIDNYDVTMTNVTGGTSTHSYEARIGLIVLSHALYVMWQESVEDSNPLKDRLIHVPFPNGAIPAAGLIDMVKTNAFADAGDTFGNVSILDSNPQSKSKLVAANTIGALKTEYEQFNSQFTWTEEEKLFIPSFPDDTPVPTEVITMANAYLKTRDMHTPMVNFLWRGITSFGKSTGAKMLACILNRPLLHQTCSTNMEVQDFLSTFVPDNGGAAVLNKPTVDEIYLDPESAWSKMTGESRVGVSAQECLDELTRRAASGSGNAQFKHVESNYVKALSRGYIIEISEISRIREPGVLVGLNDYDQPGCVIPLVDGGYTTRHQDAIVVMTDNVGYVSCRPVDPAVIRRMAMVFDSYKMDKSLVLKRVKSNTGFKDTKLLNKMYQVWSQLIQYCQDHDITEGPISMTELERWVQMVMIDGGNIYDNCVRCVVAKATSDIAEQASLKAAVLDKLL